MSASSAPESRARGDALRRLGAWPRRRLADLPTRLERVERLGSHLGVAHAYVKMDAETGFALGGNKVRKLEFELAPERLEGVTHLITAGGPQSNHCRVTAAAAAKLGLACVLVRQGPEPNAPTGNARLHELFGAEVVTVTDRADRTPAMDDVAGRVAAEGGRPLVLPLGASTGLGCLGYALAAVELNVQLERLADGCRETVLFTSASSGGTLAGLLLGFALLGRSDVRLVGVSADASAEEILTTARGLASEGAALLEADVDFDAVAIEATDTQVGGGYGIPTPASEEALLRFARLEGIVLDPTYTAKAAAGLIDWVGRHDVTADTRIVFLHTGGAPGLLS